MDELGVRMRRRVVIIAVGVAAAVFIGWHSPSVGRGTPAPDSTYALQAQLDALKPGGYLKLDSKTYEHRGVIRLRVPDVRIDGSGATFQATNDETSSVQITADGVQLTNLTLTAPTEGKRWSDLDQQKLVLSGDRDTVTHVSIVGSAAGGIFVDDARDFKIEDVSITGTRADGIHMTGGSRNGVVDNVRTDQTGDDAVAVVSYESDAEPCRDIQVNHVTVASTRWGRGIAIVGGRNVSIRDFSVANTSAAGIYVASEGNPYYTDSVESVTVSNGTVTGANRNPDVVHGALLVTAGNAGEYVRSVQISNVNISATSASAKRNVGIVVGEGSIDSIFLRDITIRDSILPALYSNAPVSAYNTSGWTLDGNPIAIN
jgi:hypothetical protein